MKYGDEEERARYEQFRITRDQAVAATARTIDSVLVKMALTIKQTINASDRYNNSLLGMGTAEVCILPRQLRKDLGECLDDLAKLDTSGKGDTK